jgi:hypothetical protein
MKLLSNTMSVLVLYSLMAEIQFPSLLKVSSKVLKQMEHPVLTSIVAMK